jgi:hypothetical protein
VKLFEGGPQSKFQSPKEIAASRALEGKRPAFTANSYPPQMKDLLRQCWDEDPMKRPTFANIIDCLEDILFRLEHKKLVRSNSFRFFPCMSLKQNPFYHA